VREVERDEERDIKREGERERKTRKEKKEILIFLSQTGRRALAGEEV
jgi:hypothetical protein